MIKAFGWLLMTLARMTYEQMCTQSPESLPGVKIIHQSVGLIEMIYDVINSSRWEIGMYPSHPCHFDIYLEMSSSNLPLTDWCLVWGGVDGLW